MSNAVRQISHVLTCPTARERRRAALKRRVAGKPAMALSLSLFATLALGGENISSGAADLTPGRASAAPASAIPLGDNLVPSGLMPVLGHAGKLPQVGFVTVPDRSTVSGEPGALRYRGSLDEYQRARNCLATAAWYEAGDDPAGQRSVMQVILNRLHHPSFPKSICGVVYQGSERKTGCQFSYTCDGSMRRRFPSPGAWVRASRLADEAMNGKVDPDVFNATHYHADYVTPWWSSKLKALAKIGAHIFYRWPGSRGELARSVTLASESAVKPPSLSGLPRPTAPEFPASDGSGRTAAGPGEDGMASLAAASAGRTPNGGVVRDSALVVALPADAASGSWAMLAMRQCAGRPSCQVLGYVDAAQASANRIAAAASRSRPAFLFIRDGASAMTVALWNCEIAERPQASQCLPAEGSALRKLMRRREG